MSDSDEGMDVHEAQIEENEDEMVEETEEQSDNPKEVYLPGKFKHKFENVMLEQIIKQRYL